MKDCIASMTSATNTDSQCDRFRELDTNLGRWTRQDPVRYMDGASVYQAFSTTPVNSLDALGLMAETEDGSDGPTTRPTPPPLTDRGVEPEPFDEVADDTPNPYKKNESYPVGPFDIKGLGTLSGREAHAIVKSFEHLDKTEEGREILNEAEKGTRTEVVVGPDKDNKGHGSRRRIELNPAESHRATDNMITLIDKSPQDKSPLGTRKRCVPSVYRLVVHELGHGVLGFDGTPEGERKAMEVEGRACEQAGMNPRNGYR